MIDDSGSKPVGDKQPPPSPSSPGDGPPLPPNIKKNYPASQAPAIKSWFKKNFPLMTDAQLDKATSQFMAIEMKFLASVQKRLDKQREKANEEMKKSIEGE